MPFVNQGESFIPDNGKFIFPYKEMCLYNVNEREKPRVLETYLYTRFYKITSVVACKCNNVTQASKIPNVTYCPQHFINIILESSYCKQFILFNEIKSNQYICTTVL